MVFAVGQEPQVFKAKNGQLTVVRPHLSAGDMTGAFPFGASTPVESSAQFQPRALCTSSGLDPHYSAEGCVT